MGRRSRLRARHIGAVVPVGDNTEGTMHRRQQTRAERTQAARERASGHSPVCTCGARPPTNAEWFRIRNFVDQPDRAAIYIYEEIGYWGTSANEFVQQLHALNVDFLDVHINSPGGEVDDGIAIFNALRQHKAYVTVYIDSLAASAASFIAMAGDKVCISEFGQVMVHDAMGLAFGNEAEVLEFAGVLGRYSNNVAAIYARQAGGTPEQWRDVMRAETWYTGAEAVDAGLCDEVHDLTAAGEYEDEPMAARMTARWDMSLYAFRYQGREAAPAPPMNQAEQSEAAPAVTEDVTTDTESVVTPDVSHENEVAVRHPESAVEPADTEQQVTGDPETATDATSDPDEAADGTASDAGTGQDSLPADTAVDGADTPAAEPDGDLWAQLATSLTAPLSPDDEFTKLTKALKGA